jgi:hypothetical protein
VFASLLNNAAKYADEGGEIFISAARGEKRRDLRRDTGVGIPADMLPRVFEMFVQADRHPRAQGGESGSRSFAAWSRCMAAAERGKRRPERRVYRQAAAAAQQRPAAARQPLASGARRFAARAIVDDNHDAADALGSPGLLGAQVRVVHDGPARSKPSVPNSRRSYSWTSACPAWTDSKSRAASAPGRPARRALVALTAGARRRTATDRRRGFSHISSPPISAPCKTLSHVAGQPARLERGRAESAQFARIARHQSATRLTACNSLSILQPGRMLAPQGQISHGNHVPSRRPERR